MGLLEAVVLDSTGDPVGRVVEILVDPASRDPRWLRVVLGASPDAMSVLVPVAAVSETASDVLTAAYDATTIESARHTGSTLSSDDAARLSELYGLPDESRAP